MRKVLVLTLVLVMAFASSALAAVSFSGKFTATFEQDSFKLGVDEYTLTPNLDFTISGSNKDVTALAVEQEAEEGEEEAEPATEDYVNWEFSAGLTDFALGKYKLVLNDNHFTASVWGNGQELSDKATYFNMIKAGKAASEMRARVEADVLGYADVTVDFDPGETVRLFVDSGYAGFDFGAAYARKGWTGEAANVVVGSVGTEFGAGDVTIGVKAEAGFDIKEDLGIALGFSADADLTEQLSVEASVTNANAHWKNGDALKADNTVLSGGVTWEDLALKATASVEQILVKDQEEENTNTITLNAWYRFSDTLDYADLFKSDKWYTNDALALHAWLSLEDIELGMVGVEAAMPLVQDMVWGKAFAKYGVFKYKDETDQAVDENGDPKFDDGKPVYVEKTDTGFEVRADFYVTATPKLTIMPYAGYASVGNVLTLGTGAEYKIGYSDTTINLTVEKVTADEILESKNAELIKASVTVPF